MSPLEAACRAQCFQRTDTCPCWRPADCSDWLNFEPDTIATISALAAAEPTEAMTMAAITAYHESFAARGRQHEALAAAWVAMLLAAAAGPASPQTSSSELEHG